MAPKWTPGPGKQDRAIPRLGLVATRPGNDDAYRLSFGLAGPQSAICRGISRVSSLNPAWGLGYQSPNHQSTSIDLHMLQLMPISVPSLFANQPGYLHCRMGGGGLSTTGFSSKGADGPPPTRTQTHTHTDTQWPSIGPRRRLELILMDSMLKQDKLIQNQ